MRRTKWLIGIGLLTSIASVYCCASTINHYNASTTHSLTNSSLQDPPAKIPLTTVFGTIPNYILADGTTPTDSDVFTYLRNRITSSDYADVINDIQIDSYANNTVTFSAKPKSRRYTGLSSFGYTSKETQLLSKIFGTKDDLENKGNWNDQPSNIDFLSKVKLFLYDQLDINQIYVSIANDANSLGGVNYSVQISAIPNSTLYSGSAVIKYELNDTRKELSQVFTVGVSTPFEWGQFNSADQNKPSILNTICSVNNVDTQKISAFTYTLTYNTTDKTITLSVSDNPYYKDGSIDFTYKVVTAQPFTLSWAEIQDPSKGNGVGWSYATVGKGSFTFIPIDITNHTVYIIDACNYTNSGITTKLEADNMIIGSKITNPSDQQVWTITGLAGRGDTSIDTDLVSDAGTFYHDTGLTGSISLPSTIKYIGKNAFRDCPNITSLNLNEGLETIYGHSCMTIGCTNLQSISIPSTLSNLSENIFSGANLTDIYLYRSTHIYSQLVYQSPTPVNIFYSIPQYTSNNPRTGKIHVPMNLLDEYINSPQWQSWIGVGPTSDPAYYTRQVFQPIQRLSDVIGSTINLPAYAPVESMLSLLCYVNKIDPDKIKNYEYSISGYTSNGGAPGTMTIKVVNNPNYYGSVDVYWTKNSFTTFDVTYSQLNGNGGWSGYTAGDMRFWVIDSVNKIVEFNQGSNCIDSGLAKLEGTNVTIGNTITYQGVTYEVLGTYNSGSEENGLRNGAFNGSITVGNQIKILDRCCFRELKEVTSVIFEPNSTLAEFGGCATMKMTSVTSWDIPASVKTIQYGNFGSSSINDECATNIIFRSDTMYPYLMKGDTGSGTATNIFYEQRHLRVDHALRIYVQPELVNQYRNDPDWQTACGGLANATMMILPIANQLTPPLTSSSQDGYTITTSSENTNDEWKPWHAFDGVTNTADSAWATSTNTIKTGWLRVEMPAAKKLISYQIYPSFNINFQTSSPKTWTFQGSNDGTNWTNLDSRTDISDWASTRESYKEFYIANFEANASYKYYRINVTANNGGNFLLISELKLFGY